MCELLPIGSVGFGSYADLKLIPILLNFVIFIHQDTRRLAVAVTHGLARTAAIMASAYKAYLGVGVGPLSVSVNKHPPSNHINPRF